MRRTQLDYALGVCWSRTATFMKLCKHKTINGNLPGDYQDYSLNLIAEFRNEECEILKAMRYMERGGDWEKKKDTYKVYNFSKIEYDQRMRDIIDRVKKKIELGL